MKCEEDKNQRIKNELMRRSAFRTAMYLIKKDENYCLTLIDNKFNITKKTNGKDSEGYCSAVEAI